MQKIRSRAFLVLIQTRQKFPAFLDEAHEEMNQLLVAAGMRSLGAVRARIQHPSPSHFVREGKLEEIRVLAKQAGADTLVFNVDLTPVQARNIEADTKVAALDRTGLILDIFARRAKSREGKMQVELARLNYLLPRIGGLGGVMSRLGGGVGTRGPGEQELEHDRRKIRRRIQILKEDLKGVSRHRQLIRSSRKRKQLLSVALVGYTNAGKSTLLNALTGADSYVEDKVFATLDPKARIQKLGGSRPILFVDTVGFIKDLPHTLVESFHATLEEVVDADILIHVLDASHPRAGQMHSAVEKVLEEIKAQNKPAVLALNKADMLNDLDRGLVLQEWPHGILISAKDKAGLHSLLAKVNQQAAQIGQQQEGPEDLSNANWA